MVMPFGFIRDNIRVVVVTALVTLFLCLAAVLADRHFSSYSFCTSCHSMSYPAAEIKESRHYGSLGVNPECADCHLPRDFFNRAFAHMTEGVKDMKGELTLDLSTREKFDAHRPAFAHAVRVWLKKTDSSTCRACHKAPRPASGGGKLAHRRMESEKLTCIDCHQNIFHRPVPEEDLNAAR